MSSDSKSPHIFNISANLFGLCFVVFTYLKASKIAAYTILDEITAICMFLFMVSCATSFLAMRSNSHRALVYDRVADYVFMTGMFALFITTMLIVFNAILLP